MVVTVVGVVVEVGESTAAVEKDAGPPTPPIREVDMIIWWMLRLMPENKTNRRV